MNGTVVMEEKPKITYRKRRELPPARIRRHWPGGIFWRELRAGLPTVTALAGIVALIALLNVVILHLRQAWGQPFMLSSTMTPDSVLTVVTLIVFFLMGVLCGGEEAENGTADFARRLPVSRLHIYAAKTAGALCGVAVWYVLAVALADLVILTGLTGFSLGDKASLMINPFHNPLHTLLPAFSHGLFLFFCGQAAAAWIERVIVGALVGGAPAIGYIILVYLVYANTHRGMGRDFSLWHFSAFLIGSAVALIAALYRFQTREGR